MSIWGSFSGRKPQAWEIKDTRSLMPLERRKLAQPWGARTPQPAVDGKGTSVNQLSSLWFVRGGIPGVWGVVSLESLVGVSPLISAGALPGQRAPLSLPPFPVSCPPLSPVLPAILNKLPVW